VLKLSDMAIAGSPHEAQILAATGRLYEMTRFMVRHLVRGSGVMPAEAAAEIFLKVTVNYDEMDGDGDQIYRWLVQNARLAVEHERDENPEGRDGRPFDPGEAHWLEHLGKDDAEEGPAWGRPADWWKQ
jgi:hypothetical protein